GDDLATLLRDPHPRVREHGVLLADKRTTDATLAKLLQRLAEDPDARVRYQVALALGNGADENKALYLAKIALAAADEQWTRLAVASSAADCAGKMLERMFASRKELDRLSGVQRTKMIHE